MHISVKGQYALRAIFDLAAHNSGEPVRIALIAKRQSIPQKFLELILAGLKQGGFVESRRGVEGGYLLARPPEAITVGEVLRFVEGAQTAKNHGWKHTAETPFTGTWRRVDDAVSGIIDHTSFAEILRDWTNRQGARAPNWDI